MNIETIRNLARSKKIYWSQHVAKRMAQRDILAEECMKCLLEGDIIEEYPMDYPYPSCLMLEGEKPLHVVCAIGKETDLLYIITAYVPDPEDWEDDLRRRRKK